jgi:hypothetical protein
MGSTTISESHVVTDDAFVESAFSSVEVRTATTLWSGVVLEIAVVENGCRIALKCVHASTISIRTSSVSVDVAAVERDRDSSCDVYTTTVPPPW